MVLRRTSRRSRCLTRTIPTRPTCQVCSPAGTGTIYLVAFATGKSLLINNSTDSSGNTTTSYIPSKAVSTGVITDVAIMNVNGSLEAVVGDSSSGTTSPPADLGLRSSCWSPPCC